MMHHSRRSLLKTVAALGATYGLPSLVLAQTFPDKTKPIKGIAPYSAGSAVDVVARAYAQAMSEILGTNVLIENRAGAEGVIGLQAVKTAPTDGYTMLFTSLSTQVVNPHMFKQLTYDPLKDFIPLAGTMKSIQLMNSGPSLPFKTTREFIEAAKAKPGKYTYASISATTRLTAQMFAKAADIKLLNVPYRSFSDLTADLLSGRVDLLFADGPSVMPFVKQGLRVLAALSPTRSPSLPDIPTMQEQGVPALEVIGWHGAYVPAKTPSDVVTVLRDAVVKASSSKHVTDYFKSVSVEPLPLVGDKFAEFQAAEYEKWGKAVNDAGLKGSL
jgi:tripartite-type tricarboxylate transporter receptor subunit TctC